jgi:hypothetical protein
VAQESKTVIKLADKTNAACYQSVQDMLADALKQAEEDKITVAIVILKTQGKDSCTYHFAGAHRYVFAGMLEDVKQDLFQNP